MSLEVRSIEAPPPDAAQHEAMRYARKLTGTPASLIEADMGAVRGVGYDDGQILEVSQVCAYFAYDNRTVVGLGCSTTSDILGLSPGNSADPEDWGHA